MNQSLFTLFVIMMICIFSVSSFEVCGKNGGSVSNFIKLFFNLFILQTNLLIYLQAYTIFFIIFILKFIFFFL